jgi:hypothetical protein
MYQVTSSNLLQIVELNKVQIKNKSTSAKLNHR